MGTCCCTLRKKKSIQYNEVIHYRNKTYSVLNDQLGKGHYGIVYKGLINQKHNCAIKVIPKKKFTISELKALELIHLHSHNNILYVYSVFRFKTYYYIISDICPGSELYDKIHDKTITEIQAYKIMKQLLLAIDHLHSIGIIHRDIKPENIMISNTFTIKVIDLGLAKIESDIIYHKNKCRRLKQVGTPYYLDPNVIKQYYSELCDEWSAGIVYYILIVAYPPYNGATDETIISNIRDGKEYYDSKDWKKVSAHTITIINLLKERDITKRKSASYILNEYMTM